MKFYCVAEIEITDPGWVPDYLANVTKMVEAQGGRYLARTPLVEKLEGERPAPQIMLILEWPSREAALAFFESEEYAPYRKSRREGARSEFLLVAGDDVAKVAILAD